jgi:hypothetical protein
MRQIAVVGLRSGSASNAQVPLGGQDIVDSMGGLVGTPLPTLVLRVVQVGLCGRRG